MTEDFDIHYAHLWKELRLNTLHISNITSNTSVQYLSPGLTLVTFNCSFIALSRPREGECYVVLPLQKGLSLNASDVNVGGLVFATNERPCVIKAKYNETTSFVFLKLNGLNRHFNLLASSCMPIQIEKRYVLLAEDHRSYITNIEKALMGSTPSMRPGNLLGRSRIPRKDLVRDLFLDLCKTLDSKQSVKRVSLQYGISERTTRDAFLQVAGITAKRFMIHQQIFRYRQLLVHSQSGSIESVAAELGISAPGRIAKEYCTFFNEKPNATLKRCIAQYKDRL